MLLLSPSWCHAEETCVMLWAGPGEPSPNSSKKCIAEFSGDTVHTFQVCSC